VRMVALVSLDMTVILLRKVDGPGSALCVTKVGPLLFEGIARPQEKFPLVCGKISSIALEGLTRIGQICLR